MKKTAFTLMELLIVVSIIGVLAAIGVPSYQGYMTYTKEKTATGQCHNVFQKIRNEISLMNSGSISKIHIDTENSSSGFISLSQSPSNLAISFKSWFDGEKFMNPWQSNEVVVSIVNTSINENDTNEYGNISIIGDDTSKNLTLECIVKPGEKTVKTFLVE